jgi:hypothetical protein
MPPPLSVEQILQDLKDAPQSDVVFTSTPPGHKPSPKGQVKGEFLLVREIEF